MEQPLCIVGSVLNRVAKILVIEGMPGKWNSLYVL